MGKEDILSGLLPLSFFVSAKKEDLWDSQNLESLLEVLRQGLCDYRLNILHMRSIPDKALNGMNSDLKYVIGMIKQNQSRECYQRFIQENKDYFSRIPRSAFDLIDACINLNYIGGLIGGRDCG